MFDIMSLKSGSACHVWEDGEDGLVSICSRSNHALEAFQGIARVILNHAGEVYSIEKTHITQMRGGPNGEDWIDLILIRLH